MNRYNIYVTGDWKSEKPFASIMAESTEVAKKAVAKASGLNVLTLQAFESGGLPLCPGCHRAYDGFCLHCERNARAAAIAQSPDEAYRARSDYLSRVPPSC